MEIKDYELDKVIQAKDRQEAYKDWRRRHDIWQARKAINEYHNFILINSIFITDNIADKMLELDDKAYGKLNIFEDARQDTVKGR